MTGPDVMIEHADALRCINALLVIADRTPGLADEYRMAARRIRANVLLARANAHLEAQRP